MKKITLGALQVGRVGLGAMTMSAYYTGAGQYNDEAERAIHRALDLGVDFIDTAEVYGPYINEELLGRVLKTRREEVVLASKFGFISHLDDAVGRELDSRPENIRRALEGSLRRLQTDHIDLYYQHRVDPSVPIEDVIGTLAELITEGKLGHIGLSEAAPETIRRAHAVHPIAALQTEYSLWTRDVEPELLPLVAELGIGFVAYSPLGRGFLTGKFRSLQDFAPDDFRLTNPRFTEENFQTNLALVDEVAAIARDAGATPAQVALAWLLSRSEHLAVIPGTKRVHRVEENSAADAIELSPEQLARLGALRPAAGERYGSGDLLGINQ